MGQLLLRAMEVVHELASIMLLLQLLIDWANWAF